jgi:transposase
MSEKRTRRHFSAQEKVAILKCHLLEKVPISNLCDEFDVYPNQIYGWLKEFFENGHAAFDNGRKSKAEEEAKDRKIEQLEAKIQRKDSVLAELMEEHTLLKKDLGEI